MLTAHPLVGIFGSTYLLVFGAFTFLVPFLMKKPLWSFKMATWTLWLIVIGVFTFWVDGFLTHYAPLYTLYWPLPADFNQFAPVAGAVFIVGIALVMVGTLFFVINVFKTITYTPQGWTKQPAGRLLGDLFSVSPRWPSSSPAGCTRTPSRSTWCPCRSPRSPAAPWTCSSTSGSSCSSRCADPRSHGRGASSGKS